MNDAKRLTVIDADGHITEPPTLWSNYVEEAYRDRAPQGTLDEHGHPCMILDGKLIMRHAMLLTLGPEYSVADYKPQPGGWDPAARLVHMDAEGIDVAVLFPSIGLYFSDISDAKLMAALCRGYNDWLADYCRHAPRASGRRSRCFRSSTSPNRSVSSTRATEQLGFRGAFFRPNPYAGRADSRSRRTSPSGIARRRSACRSPCTRALSDSMPTLGARALLEPRPAARAVSSLRADVGLRRADPHRRAGAASCVARGLPRDRGRGGSRTGWSGWTALGHVARRAARRSRMKPSEYFRRQCMISTEPDDEVVDTVVTHVGDDYVIWASDYPHPDAHFPGAVTKTLESMASVPEDSRRKILATNAARLYGLAPAA